MKNELHNILSGKSEVRFGAIIQAITNYLEKSKETSIEIENTKHFRKQETKQLEEYIIQKNLWVDVDFSQYVSEGAEQRVFLKDLHDENVLTQNDILYFIDTVFYLTDEFWK